MTNQGVKFYKFSNSTSSAGKIASAKATQGAIIYIVDARELWIGGATAAQAQLVIKGANDVTFTNNVLTLTHYDNTGTATTQTLNFSDVASASSTMAVFQQIYTKMGLTGDDHDTIDYSGTNYLSDLGTTGHPDKNLVNADKALDAAILEATLKDGTTGAVYDTTAQEISQTWITTVNTNAIADNETLNTSVNKLDKKIAGLADELIRDEQVTQEAFTAVSNSVGLESDMSLDLSAASHPDLTIIQGDTSVKEALIDLDAAFADAGKVDDVKINNTSIVSNKIANIAVDGTYDASTNKVASQSTVTNAINALDVSTDKGAASISGSTITINAVQQEDGLIKDGGSTTINLDGTYDASTNKIATESTVSDVIEALDTQADVQPVVYTAPDTTNGAKLTFKGVSETDGVIAQGSGNTELQFAKVATTGAAEDVSYVNTTSGMQATDVQSAIDTLDNRVDALEASFDVIKSTNAANTPAGVTWIDNTDPDNPQTITGTLTASDATFHKVYLVPANGGSSPNSYDEYITTKDGNNYAWERLGTIDVDLTGYVKTITANGTSHAVDSQSSTNVTLGNIINDVTGETAIAGGESGLVAVTPTNTTDANGVRTSDLATTVKIEEVADGIVKDGTASYTEGHYVIENGKLVSAVGKSTGDTYTISANDGLTKASDVAAYVESKTGEGISSLDVPEYQQASVDVDTTNHASTLKIKGIKEDDGKIAAATTTPTTDVEIEGEYNASTNKIATQSTITNAINALDANPTSDDAAVANVQVVETDGVITDVVVTNVSAGVSYTASTASTAPNLAATTSTGAVTGADIDTIKNYIDDAATLKWEEYE